MKISKLFHWLYSILMLLPFGLVVFNALASMWSGNVITTDTWYSYICIISDFVDGGVSLAIYNVYEYLFDNVFSIYASNISALICDLLTYWTCISIIWLIFDVFMYVPLLVHRWIDKAKIE